MGRNPTNGSGKANRIKLNVNREKTESSAPVPIEAIVWSGECVKFMHSFSDKAKEIDTKKLSQNGKKSRQMLPLKINKKSIYFMQMYLAIRFWSAQWAKSAVCKCHCCLNLVHLNAPFFMAATSAPWDKELCWNYEN